MTKEQIRLLLAELQHAHEQLGDKTDEFIIAYRAMLEILRGGKITMTKNPGGWETDDFVTFRCNGVWIGTAWNDGIYHPQDGLLLDFFFAMHLFGFDEALEGTVREIVQMWG